MSAKIYPMTTQELRDVIEDKAQIDAGYAIAFAILQLTQATDRLATQVKWLGNGDAADPRGALEAFGMHIGDRLDGLASAIESLKEDAP